MTSSSETLKLPPALMSGAEDESRIQKNSIVRPRLSFDDGSNNAVNIDLSMQRQGHPEGRSSSAKSMVTVGANKSEDPPQQSRWLTLSKRFPSSTRSLPGGKLEENSYTEDRPSIKSVSSQVSVQEDICSEIVKLENNDCNNAESRKQSGSRPPSLQASSHKVIQLISVIRNIRQWVSHKTAPKPPERPDSFLEKFVPGWNIEVEGDSQRSEGSRPDNKPPTNWQKFWYTCGRGIAVDTAKPSYYWWLGIVSLTVLYNIIFVIGRSIFWDMQNSLPNTWFVLDLLTDFIYCADSFVHAHQAYLQDGMLVRDAYKLRKNYWKSTSFKVDLMSVLPTDYVALYWIQPTRKCSATELPCAIIWRLNRLLRFTRLNEFFRKTESRINAPNGFRIGRVILYILIIIHWNACFYFWISYAIGCGSDGWVYKCTMDDPHNNSIPKNNSLAHQYIYSFYWSTLTLTTIGETPQPEYVVEYIFVVADYLIGVLIFATIVGNIGSMITHMNAARAEFQDTMDSIKQYMDSRRVSKELQKRVIKWFDYIWTNKQAVDENKVLAALPNKLKAEIAIHVHLDTLRQVRIFQDCEPGLLAELVLKLKLQVFSPGDYICRKGDVGREMYIVKRGKVSVVGDDGKTVFVTLGGGCVFGEISILNIAGNRTGNRRTANVRSVGYSDLFCLSKDDLWDALEEYPEARDELLRRGKQILQKDGLIDEEALEAERLKSVTQAEKIVKLEGEVDNLQTRLARLLADYNSFQQKFKQRLAKVEKREDREN